MTQSTPERKPCGTCGEKFTVTATGGMRSHSTDNPAFQAEPDNPDNRKCRGVGEPPAGAKAPGDSNDGPQCRLCKHPVQLSSNGRARSHLTPEATPRPCPAGSDFPLGTYPEIVGTTDGLVATLAFDCEHREAGACWDCYGARAAESCPDHDDPIECTCQAKAGQARMAAEKQLTMAERLKAVETDDFGRPVRECFNCDVLGCTGCGEPLVDSRTAAMTPVSGEPDDDRPEASRFTELLARETRGAGTVLDRIDPAVLQNRQAPELSHQYTDSTGVVWDHNGPAETCEAPDCVTMRQAADDDGLMDVYGRTKSGGVHCPQCDTDDHRCPGCGTDVRHGVVACDECTARVDAEKAERQEACTHPDGFQDTLHADGQEVPACEHCDAVAPASKLPRGETDDGRPCDHADGLFGLEDGNPVCVACGTECTHPDGYAGTADVPGSDDQDRVVSVCEICGTVNPEDAEPVGPDPELPNCPHPMTHRAGCGCPDDDYTPGQYSPDNDPQVRLGELDEGDYFIRNGTVMRLTEKESRTSVLAEVVEGPHKGRTGELTNLNEVVHRVPEPESKDSYAGVDPRDVMGMARRGAATVREAADRDQRAKTDVDWRTPADLLAKMSEEIRGMDALRFNCAGCKHPITPLVDQFSFDGRAAVVSWACEQGITSGYRVCRDHECRPDCLVSIGDLEFGEFFVRRGVLMRCTSSGYGLVEAVVVEGPMKGRTGELKNPAEQVERTYCRHDFSYADDGQFGHSGTFCDYCGKGQETTECTDDRTATRQPRSSAAQAAPGTTAKASTNGRTAAVTTDQDAAAAAFLGNGRTSAPAQNGSANQADAAAQFLAGGSGAHGEVETKRDRFGRYLIPHPDTGKETAWTRSTTFAKSISDTYALSQWGLRMALLGATVRPDIVQRAHGKHVKVDKQLLDELTADLKNAAGDKVAANLGTSMHSFTEMADRAWHSPGGPRSVLDQIPPDCQGMVATYIRLLEETGLEPVPHLIEFTTVVKQYGVAGTSDNCYKVTKPLKLKIGRAEVQLNPGEYVIGDKKTGKDLDYGWQEIVIQLATYAQGINTAGVWDRKDEVWEPDPLSRFDKPGTKVRLDAGIVVHLPVDKESEKQPAVYGVDLESGWNAAVLCERVRAWRKVRYLASPVMVSEEGTTFVPAPSTPGVTSRPKPAVVTQTTVRPPTLRDRASNVTSKSEASAVWKDAKEDGLSDAEVDELVAVMQDRLRKLAEPGG